MKKYVKTIEIACMVNIESSENIKISFNKSLARPGLTSIYFASTKFIFKLLDSS